ncbi:NAD(+) diphosphatase [Nocardioides panacis]|uniref:NAD(+) diphosphatase n=1 Tax=Nocardioides panacis TaxID=2849501 RepID=UPI0020B2733C|nr:NAD(+) diphosphatase [Nocardioides panacis]
MTSPQFPAPGSTDIALSVRTHDRVGERRTDTAWLEETWADPASRIVPVAGNRFPVDEAGGTVRWQGAAELPDQGLRLFLGMRGEVAHFALVVEEPTDDGPWAAFRSVLATLPEPDAGFMVHAVALAEWHASHRFCPRCGSPLVSTAAGHVLRCAENDHQQFPRTDPAVIMMVTDGERALLGRQAAWPEGRYSTLAGFVDPGESLEEAVIREVAEETGVHVTDVAYFGNQPWPFPQSLMVGFFARATSTDILVDGEEIQDARWFTRAEMKEQAEAGTLVLPGGISISRSLVEAWYGGPLPGSW